MTAKEYLQGKHEWHKKHWNEHEHIDDNWWANEMEEYHQAKLKLLGIANVSKSALNDEWNSGYNQGCEDTHAAYKDQM